MHHLNFVCFAFSIPLAIGAYHIDEVYELQPGIQPFNIDNNYSAGKSSRYQFTAPSYYKVKAICSVNIGVSSDVANEIKNIVKNEFSSSMVMRAAPTIFSHTLKMVQPIYTAINQYLDAAESMEFRLSRGTIQLHLE